MFTTTFAAVALGSILSAGAVTAPAWQSDYSKALKSAAADQKPIAVFIGKGEAGYSKLVGGQIPAEAGQLLAKSYVCVYVDTDTVAGKSLAGQFDMTKGVVISCKGGNVQALRYAGPVSPTQLTTYLSKYSDAKTVATTEMAGESVVPAGAIYGGCPNGRCPTSSYAPIYSGYAPFSTCPNGKCPNVR
jgi:hypothetical protein